MLVPLLSAADAVRPSALIGGWNLSDSKVRTVFTDIETRDCGELRQGAVDENEVGRQPRRWCRIRAGSEQALGPVEICSRPEVTALMLLLPLVSVLGRAGAGGGQTPAGNHHDRDRCQGQEDDQPPVGAGN